MWTEPGKNGAPASSSGLAVGFVSLGCAKNRVDSQVMANALLSAGFRMAPSPEVADVVLVNTCAFIRDAREESLGMVREACRLKRRGPCRAVIVAGCLSQRYGRDLPAQWPEVDAFVGLDELEDVPAVIRRVLDGERGILAVGPRAERLYEPGKPGVVFSTGPYAYLKISEGCDHRCAFCAIPAIRGAYRSRPVERVVAEAEGLLEQGFRELALVSQDVTGYGRDRGDGATLAGLLTAMGRIGGDFWIRLLYGYPSRVTDELLEVMGTVRQVCRYLDLPIQHSHPDLLRAMGRGDTVQAVAALAGRVRAALPGAALRTTCLLGFPGERPEHVEHLLGYLREGRFDHVGAFAFSPEEGTRAERMRPRPARREAESRRDRVMQQQSGIVKERHGDAKGCMLRVLVERAGARPGTWRCRSEFQAPEVDGLTLVHSETPLSAGEFTEVRVTGFDGYDLRADARDVNCSRTRRRPPRAHLPPPRG